MNIQSCARCGYGVYPAEKINCIDQVSGYLLTAIIINVLILFVYLEKMTSATFV